MSSYKQGYFKPIHPEKYIGDITKIRFMSSWELSFHKFLDNNPNVLKWSSENIVIPYVKPTDGKVHRYYPDYWVEYKDKEGTICREVIEVKPKAQTARSKKRNPKQKLVEDITYAINVAKWTQAQKWCDERGLKFRIITECSLFSS